MEQVCVYCGSSAGKLPLYSAVAEALAEQLNKQAISLVYGGASVGVMGVLADAVLAGGGDVVGIIPTALADKEIAHQGLTELLVVDSMHTRKAKMAQLADGFIALPGGLGTLEELFEMLTWAQLGYHRKPIALLNVNGYYNELLAFLKNSVRQGFVAQAHIDMLIVADCPKTLLKRMQMYQAPNIKKILTRKDL